MREKKRIRQEQKKLAEQKQIELSRPIVTLNKDDSYYGNYRWNCPNHDGTFSWSKQINAQWGHPDDKAFCAVCFKYYNIQFA